MFLMVTHLQSDVFPCMEILVIFVVIYLVQYKKSLILKKVNRNLKSMETSKDGSSITVRLKKQVMWVDGTSVVWVYIKLDCQQVNQKAFTIPILTAIFGNL